MKKCAELHSIVRANQFLTLDCTFEATLPSLSDKSMTFLKLIQWTTSNMQLPNWEQALALKFLESCMDLDPRSRISASDALDHPFLSSLAEDELIDDDVFLT